MTSYILDPGEPLAALEIRSLENYPSTIADNKLRCRLFCTPLDSTQLHPYEALPYVWGDATMRANITCIEKPVLVALNLFDAFKRLRLLCEPPFV
jgi:hypothetical protein